MDNIRDRNRIDKAQIIENQMTSKIFGKNIIYYDAVDSTNTVAKRLGKEPGRHGVLVLAESQSAGRGRMGREWDSPKNEGIWMSLILQPAIDICNASMLTLIAALAVNRGIRNVTKLNSFIKWPNDIIINGKKVCGILTEMSTTKDMLECIVVGIGINVSNNNFDRELRDKATSLSGEGYLHNDKIQLLNEIMVSMEYYYDIFLKTQNLKELSKEYNNALINIDKTVKIIERGNEFIGVALGINELGELLVKTDVVIDGEKKEVIKEVVSGEVSVRGVYGYI